MKKEDLLLKAREYEQEFLNKLSGKPVFHMVSPVGWINDPNGFSTFGNEYHLFFQYHPYSTQWGPMHWGHAVTEDFVHWKHLPAVMAPEEEYDDFGCFSGSALEVNGEHVLMYTGVHKDADGSEDESIQEQCIAFGDGLDYIKYENNPVITADMLPEGHDRINFRDPKLYKWKDKYRAILGNHDENEDGLVVVFESDDLKKWNYVETLDRSNFEYGGMWECPDLFMLDGKDVLIHSPQFMEAKDLEFHNGNNTMCIVGEIKDEKMERDYVQAIDYGLDFYAPQTLETKDGRRIMVGWLQSWDNFLYPKEFNWSGIMSIPRELTLSEGRLCQNPVRELNEQRKNEIRYETKLVNEKTSFDGINGRAFDLEIDFTKMDGQLFEIGLACNDKYSTKIQLNKDEKLLTFDRTYSGMKKDAVSSRMMRVDEWGVGSSLRIIMDQYSIEIFVNGGKYVMSNFINTSLEAEDITFYAAGTFEFELKKYEI